MTGDDKQDIRDLLAANERLGAALTFVYHQYPHIKDEVAEYLASYPFEGQG